jgi:osmotically-inducible protein OsmY
MKSIRMHRLALALAAVALSTAPAFAQNAISRVNGNTAVTGVTLDANTLSAPTDAITPEARGDQGLLTSLVNALAADPRMDGARVEVQVAEGRVTLGGVVRDAAQSQAARSIADVIAGPANVTNRLTTGG